MYIASDALGAQETRELPSHLSRRTRIGTLLTLRRLCGLASSQSRLTSRSLLMVRRPQFLADLCALLTRLVGFNEKVKAGKEKASGSGFGGKGLEKLDQERDLARRRQRKQYGEEGGEEVAEETTEAAEDIAVKPIASATQSSTPAPPDDGIVVHKRNNGALPDALDRVKQAASAVDNRLKKNGELRSGVPIDNKGPDAGAYHATLEINDFPRKCTFVRTFWIGCANKLYRKGTLGRHQPDQYCQGARTDVHVDHDQGKLLPRRKNAAPRPGPEAVHSGRGRHGAGGYQRDARAQAAAGRGNGDGGGQREQSAGQRQVQCAIGWWLVQWL